MRVGFLGLIAVAIVGALPDVSMAQRLPPLRPGPAALGVPHPIPPISPPTSTSPGPPRDLYQQLTPPPPVISTVIYPPGFVYGPYGPYAPFGPSVYVGSAYAAAPESLARPAAVSRAARGGLRFESSPGTAQVYVDGRYFGLVDDFGISGRALDLDEGAHRVELRQAEYATLSFDVNISASQTTRYRGDLQRLSPSVAAPAPAPAATLPARPKATYVIPNCYAGDRPPSRALPRGCDLRLLRVSSR